MVFTISPMIRAQQYPDSLLNYMKISAENNPTVRQKFSEYHAALQKIPQAGSLSDPELSIGVFIMPMELVNGRQMADLRLMQMFPWFGVLRHAKDEMSMMASAKYEEFRDSRLQVFYEVQRTWYELFRLKKEIEASEKNLNILGIIEDLALVRFKTSPTGVSGGTAPQTGVRRGSAQSGNVSSSGMTGMSGNTSVTVVSPASRSSMPMQNNTMDSSSDQTSLSDLYRIHIEISELINNISLLKDQEKTVSARFNSILNRHPGSLIITADTLSADTLALTPEAISDSILSKNPMLTMLEYENQSYKAREKMTRGMGFPMIGLGLNYSVIGSKDEMGLSESASMGGRDMIMPMVTLTLPVYRKRYKAMQKEAELLGQATLFNYQATANVLQNEYFEAMQMYNDARRRLDLYEGQTLLASKTLDLIMRSFSTSASGLTDVLRVRQQVLDYELNKLKAIADLNISIAMLKRLMATSGM